ncbi:hypothetical protein K466DRAFT_321062 [Polyporus arcularius HHB13444]|uniref:Uncharacterized protein n=1 Tax=Polyporus arcularius HHB13444 TaxID=1314778 RepID=A0A5C3NWP7_9APHY|nr:hypothetical protein K466DRAFT_321062 [Polyporus arcularius HHB13444]
MTCESCTWDLLNIAEELRTDSRHVRADSSHRRCAVRRPLCRRGSAHVRQRRLPCLPLVSQRHIVRFRRLARPSSGTASGADQLQGRPGYAPKSTSHHLSEPSQILDPLLRQYYPFPGPLTFLSYEDTMSALLAAHRLQLTRIAQTLADAARPHIKENPLRAYGFALRGMGGRGAPRCARVPRGEDTLMDSDELDSLTVRQYRQLVVYRQACIAALKIFHGDTMDENGRLCV